MKNLAAIRAVLNNLCLRFGKAKYENGAVYEGEFMADQRVQWGRQVFPDGSVYEGEWAADKMTGELSNFKHRSAATTTREALPRQFACRKIELGIS